MSIYCTSPRRSGQSVVPSIQELEMRMYLYLFILKETTTFSDPIPILCGTIAALWTPLDNGSCHTHTQDKQGCNGSYLVPTLDRNWLVYPWPNSTVDTGGCHGPITKEHVDWKVAEDHMYAKRNGFQNSCHSPASLKPVKMPGITASWPDSTLTDAIIEFTGNRLYSWEPAGWPFNNYLMWTDNMP